MANKNKQDVRGKRYRYKGKNVRFIEEDPKLLEKFLAMQEKGPHVDELMHEKSVPDSETSWIGEAAARPDATAGPAAEADDYFLHRNDPRYMETTGKAPWTEARPRSRRGRTGLEDEEMGDEAIRGATEGKERKLEITRERNERMEERWREVDREREESRKRDQARYDKYFEDKEADRWDAIRTGRATKEYGEMGPPHLEGIEWDEHRLGPRQYNDQGNPIFGSRAWEAKMDSARTFYENQLSQEQSARSKSGPRRSDNRLE